MELNLIESVFYGAVSGFTEFLPVSSLAHQKLLLSLLGQEGPTALVNLFVHIGLLIAVLGSYGGYFKRISVEYQYLKKSPRRRKREPNMQEALDFGFVRAAVIPLALSFLFYPKVSVWGEDTPLLVLFMILNGLLLYIPVMMARGNKDSRNMSALDGVLFGIAGAMGVLPGVSRVGASASIAIARGADPVEGYKWGMLLSIPALAVTLLVDVYSLFLTGIGGVGFVQVVMYLLSGCVAFFSGSIAISLMKTLVANKGINGFSFYCWGAALFVFILYLY